MRSNIIQPSVHPYRIVIASGGIAVAWQSPGREDLLAYTDKILAPRRLAVRILARTVTVPCPAAAPYHTQTQI